MSKKQTAARVVHRHGDASELLALRLAVAHLADVLNLTTAAYRDPYYWLREARVALVPLADWTPVIAEVIAVLDVENGSSHDPKVVAARLVRRRRLIKMLGTRSPTTKRDR